MSEFLFFFFFHILSRKKIELENEGFMQIEVGTSIYRICN